MSNSFPKQNLPLRVVLNRVGEATLNQYGAARRPMDSPEAAYRLWLEVVAEDPCHEPEKEHLVTALLNAKLRLTRKIQEVGQIVEISLLDHVIVGASEAGCAPYFSFREAGLL